MPIDRVVLVHPDLPGSQIVRSRRAVPALERAGWTEPKSSPAQAGVETSPSDEDATPSKED